MLPDLGQRRASVGLILAIPVQRETGSVYCVLADQPLQPPDLLLRDR